MKLNIQENNFQKCVKDHYILSGRHDLPWRNERTPFNAFLSEIMLQQTQVPRVIEKFTLFRKHFNNFQDIADAPQSMIIQLWQGLGYNRRALFMHKATQMIVEQFNGVLPQSRKELEQLPGIGPATSASLMVYAFNAPIPFIETNIRAVYIHHFFKNLDGIHDDELLPIIERTIDREDPYHWYSALMDYGTMIKSQHKNPSRRSRHHTVQSKFTGSKREVRGKVLRKLTNIEGISSHELEQIIDDSRYNDVINDLRREGFIREHNQVLSLL